LERRQNERVTLQVEIGLHSESNFFTGFTEDLSEGGLFIATYQVLPIGTRVRATFAIPGGEELEVEATVVWVRRFAGEGAGPGMGVRFENLSAENEQYIRRFMKHRAPLFHDV
jgi:uncharacterized protein (TIGR02266 family)